MADDSDEDAPAGRDRAVPPRTPRPRTPRWVKVFGILALVVLLLLGILLLTRGGGVHGPGRHMSSVDGPRHTAVGAA